jgi:translation initiation factor eIF-2B subunit epsilon
MGKKEKSNKKSNENEDIKKGQKLQAILLAVSFTKYFRPISYIKPKVLVPLVNVPMLMYTIEFLAQNGIEEIFLFCVRHVEMIQQFVNQLSLPSNISVRCIQSRSCLSQGDALRELDVMGVVRSDPFVLINGDVISNMDLKKAIAFHKEKRQQDGNCIMTVVLKQIQKSSGIRPLSQDLVIAQDRHTQQLLLFDNEISKTSVKIPLEVLEAHPGLRLRTDLLDCQIDICSPELLLQFSDNFDYQVCPPPLFSSHLHSGHSPTLHQERGGQLGAR